MATQTTYQRLSFRIAVPNDAEAVQQLIQAAFRAEDSRKDWTADMALGANYIITIDSVKSRIASANDQILIAEDKDKNLIACISISNRTANVVRFTQFAVDSRYQRGGIGRQVLAYAEEYCRLTYGAQTFELNTVSSRQLLISWYMRQGYQKTGMATPFPVEISRAAGVEDGLYFVELEKHLQK